MPPGQRDLQVRTAKSTPPLRRRTRTAPADSELPTNSRSPRPVVLRAIPTASETVSIPPRLKQLDSIAAQIRRTCSSRYGEMRWNLILPKSNELLKSPMRRFECIEPEKGIAALAHISRVSRSRFDFSGPPIGSATTTTRDIRFMLATAERN